MVVKLLEVFVLKQTVLEIFKSATFEKVAAFFFSLLFQSVAAVRIKKLRKQFFNTCDLFKANSLKPSFRSLPGFEDSKIRRSKKLLLRFSKQLLEQFFERSCFAESYLEFKNCALSNLTNSLKLSSLLLQRSLPGLPGLAGLAGLELELFFAKEQLLQRAVSVLS